MLHNENHAERTDAQGNRSHGFSEHWYLREFTRNILIYSYTLIYQKNHTKNLNEKNPIIKVSGSWVLYFESCARVSFLMYLMHKHTHIQKYTQIHSHTETERHTQSDTPSDTDMDIESQRHKQSYKDMNTEPSHTHSRDTLSHIHRDKKTVRN